MKDGTSGHGWRKRAGAVAVSAVLGVLVFAAVGAAGPTSASSAAKDKWTVKLKDGSTFTLAKRIAAKINSHQKINYVFSYQSSAIQGFSQQYLAGFKKTIPDANKIYPLSGKAIAPSVPAGDILSIEPSNSTGFTSIANQVLKKGIPVFTVGVTSNGNELTNFTQVPIKEGGTAAATVLSYMKAHNLHFKTFAVSGGDPSQFWAQGRMKGFRLGIQKAIPNAKFLTTESSALSVTYDPAKTYDAYKAFLAGDGKNVDVIENVDIGAGYAARAIKDAGRAGKAFSVGWNVTPDQLAAIKAGTQIALFDQNWPQQAAFGAIACAKYMQTGKVLPNTQHLTVLTKANLKQAQAKLANIKRYALTGLPGGPKK